MKITHKTLQTLRKKAEAEYDEELAFYNAFIDPLRIIESAKTLSRLTGEIKILTFLEYILDSDPEAIKILNNYLNDVQEQKKMKKIEEKINQCTKNLNDIQEQIHTSLRDMHDEFRNYTVNGLYKEISRINELTEAFKKEESNLKELKKESKPIQAYTITLDYEGVNMGSPSTYIDYLYISTNPDQNLEEVLFEEIEEVWKELGEDKPIRTVLKSDNFIQRIEDKNIYYINDEYINLKEKCIYGNITYKNYKK